MKTAYLFTLCVIAVAGCGSVQKEPKTQLTLDYPFDVGVGITDIKQEPLEYYEAHFQPPGGSMEVEGDQPGVSLALGLQPEFHQYIGSGLIIGALAKYQLHVPGGFDEYVKVDMLDWWDPVIARTIAWRRSPSVGLLFAANAPHYQQFRVQVTGFYYSLIEMYYEGVDRPDEQNTSRVMDSEELHHGFGFGFGFDFRPPWDSTNFGRIGVYADLGRSVRSLGIGWRWTTPLAGSESTIPKIE